jgi:clan AA aspartic protease
MIAGTVNANLEAVITLVLVGPAAQQQQVEAVLDTGFNGYLTLPLAIITGLQLGLLGRAQGILADGSVELFDVYRAVVLWDGQPRSIDVQATATKALLGMKLLERHSLRIDVVNGGTVAITAQP